MTMRWLAIGFAAVAVLILATDGHAQPTVYLSSQSAYVTHTRLDQDLPAFQHAVTVDFAPIWLQDATLTDIHPRPGDWPVTLTDAPAPCDLFGCVLGYHAVTRAGVPFAVVYAAQTAASRVAWSEVMTHELFEMLADPYGDRAVVEAGEARIVEVCDPVVDWGFHLPTAGGGHVQISDFVTPAWFRPGAAGPFDLLRKLGAPREMGSDGYISVWDPLTGWSTIVG
jgi:hypothetical protein